MSGLIHIALPLFHRESLSEGIINDLSNYRHKRVLGLAGMFGDQLVTSEFLMCEQVLILYHIVDLFHGVTLYPL